MTLAAIGVTVIGLNVVSYASGTLPACDAQEVMKLAENIVREAPLVKSSGVQVVGVSDAGQKSYNPSEEKRTCRATLTTAMGKEAIQYTVEWHNRTRGEIWVEIGH